jgi:hypothetical protein
MRNARNWKVSAVIALLDPGQYSHIFWISATIVDKLNQGFFNILDLVRHRDRHSHGQKLTAARPRGDDGAKWFLVFDNVDRSTLGFLRTHMPRKNARGNILFTTRTVDVTETLVTTAGHYGQTSAFHTETRGTRTRDAANLLLKDAGIDTGSVTPSLLSCAEELVACVGRLPVQMATNCLNKS